MRSVCVSYLLDPAKRRWVLLDGFVLVFYLFICLFICLFIWLVRKLSFQNATSLTIMDRFL